MSNMRIRDKVDLVQDTIIAVLENSDKEQFSNLATTVSRMTDISLDFILSVAFEMVDELVLFTEDDYFTLDPRASFLQEKNHFTDLVKQHNRLSEKLEKQRIKVERLKEIINGEENEEKDSR